MKGVVPEANTEKETVSPTVTVWLAGGVVMVGPTGRVWTVRTAPLLVALPMGYVLHRYSEQALEKIAEERNVGYAELISNALWPAYRDFAVGADQLSGDAPACRSRDAVDAVPCGHHG